MECSLPDSAESSLVLTPDTTLYQNIHYLESQLHTLPSLFPPSHGNVLASVMRGYKRQQVSYNGAQPVARDFTPFPFCAISGRKQVTADVRSQKKEERGKKKDVVICQLS